MTSIKVIGFIMALLLLGGCSTSPEELLQGELITIPVPANITGIEFRNGSLGFVVSEQGEVFRTTDGGRTFEKLALPADGKAGNVAFASNDDGFVFGKSGFLARTSDGGSSWERIATDTSYNLQGMAFLDKRHCLVVGITVSSQQKDAGIIGTSTDGGVTWAFDTTEFKGLSRISVIEDRHIWILGTNAIAYTTDRGTSWDHNLTRSTDTVRALTFSDVAHGWSVGDHGLFRYSSDGGWSWSEKPKFTGRDLTCVASPETDVVYIAGDRFIAITTNHGRKWLVDSADYPVRFSDCKSVGDNLFFAGSGGTILKLSR